MLEEEIPWIRWPHCRHFNSLPRPGGGNGDGEFREMSSIKFGVSSCCEVFPRGISHIPGGVGMGLFPIFCSVPTRNIPSHGMVGIGFIPKNSHRDCPISWCGWDGVIPNILWCSPRGCSTSLAGLGWSYSQYFVMFPQ